MTLGVFSCAMALLSSLARKSEALGSVRLGYHQLGIRLCSRHLADGTLSNGSTTTPDDKGPPNVTAPFSSFSRTNKRSQTQEGWLFVDSVFPVRLGGWECVCF